MNDKERIAELEAELTLRREQAEGLQNQWVKDTQKIVALEVKAEKLRVDAERYRWLRGDQRGRSLSVSSLEWTGNPELSDAAIDAAREKK
jgi:hypothetical protein